MVPDLKVTSSVKPKTSGESTTGSLIRKQSTKHTTAMVKLQFAEEEAELIREPASIKAEKTMLKRKKADKRKRRQH